MYQSLKQVNGYNNLLKIKFQGIVSDHSGQTQTFFIDNASFPLYGDY